MTSPPMGGSRGIYAILPGEEPRPNSGGHTDSAELDGRPVPGLLTQGGQGC
jgi:hypothetical protein